jgi:hypothetical protein
MKPIDYRNATFDSIKGLIVGQRLRVYDGYRGHGPCTTRELSQLLQMSVLSVRPRTVELVELDLLVCVARGKEDGHEGVYAVVPWDLARNVFEDKKKEATHYEQRQLL